MVERLLPGHVREERNYKEASFFFPVIDGELWLGQRNTDPFKGFYGPIGGKPERAAPDIADAHYITKMGGHLEYSIADQMAMQAGIELPVTAAIREFWEEAYCGKTRNERDITDIKKLGFVDDNPTPAINYHCHFVIGAVHRKDFSLSERELSDFRPIKGIPADTIFPIAQIALEEVRWRLEEMPEMLPPGCAGIDPTTIPPFPRLQYRFTSFTGVHMAYGALRLI